MYECLDPCCIHNTSAREIPILPQMLDSNLYSLYSYILLINKLTSQQKKPPPLTEINTNRHRISQLYHQSRHDTPPPHRTAAMKARHSTTNSRLKNGRNSLHNNRRNTNCITTVSHCVVLQEAGAAALWPNCTLFRSTRAPNRIHKLQQLASWQSAL